MMCLFSINRSILYIFVGVIIAYQLSAIHYQKNVFRSSSLSHEIIVPPKIANESNDKKVKNNTNMAFCNRIPLGNSAASLWRTNLDDIVLSLINPLDKMQKHRYWIEGLVRLMSPSHILAKGLRNMPSSKDMARLVNVMEERMRNTSAPALSVAVFGGSVAEGTGCKKVEANVIKDLIAPSQLAEWESIEYDAALNNIRGNACAWPTFLQALADKLLGPGVVEVYNLGVGGTASAQSLPIIKYHLYPPQLMERAPDIIVNAFAVNDNYYLFGRKVNNTATTTHFYSSLKVSQDFIRTVLEAYPCQQPPILIYLDEYVGNVNEILLGEDVRNDAVRVLADYYNIGYVSRGFVAKHFIMANTRESVMSPVWETPQHKPFNEVHFGMPGHIQVALVVAYSALQATLSHCSDVRAMAKKNSLVELTNEVNFIPPKLTVNLTWSNLNYEYQVDNQARIDFDQVLCATLDTSQQPCPFVFVATPRGNTPDKRSLDEYIKKFRTHNSGDWKASMEYRHGWQVKLGFIAQTQGSSVVFSLFDITNPVRVITVQYMKSYGEAWEGGQAQFDLSINDKSNNKNKGELLHTSSFALKSYHDEPTSITYTHVLDLGEEKQAVIGQNVHLNITLTHGPQFKILAIMMCSR